MIDQLDNWKYEVIKIAFVSCYVLCIITGPQQLQSYYYSIYLKQTNRCETTHIHI